MVKECKMDFLFWIHFRRDIFDISKLPNIFSLILRLVIGNNIFFRKNKWMGWGEKKDLIGLLFSMMLLHLDADID